MGKKLPDWKKKQKPSPIIEGEVKGWYEHIYRDSIFVDDEFSDGTHLVYVWQ